MRLKNKIAVVIGSSRGLGLSIARGYKAEGAKVIITYLHKKKEATARFKDENFEDLYNVDIRSRYSLQNFYSFLEAKYKKIDILVNNAGINKLQISSIKLMKSGIAYWRQTLLEFSEPAKNYLV